MDYIPLFQLPLDEPEFQLDDAFLDAWSRAEPDWGPVGYVTYRRTYSRVQRDGGGAWRGVPVGQSEEWWQTCARVVEGTYQIQQLHCRFNMTPWDAHKAQQSAQEMFRLMFGMKFLPPGRGLWMMGTDHVKRIGACALNNCFAGTTVFWANGRLVTLQDAVGETVEVLAGDGQWRPAPVRSFGVQRLQKVVFKPKGIRTNHRQTYDVTPDHRWVLADGTETTALKVGDEVKVTPHEHDRTTDQFQLGFVHGLVFGDGARHTYYPDRHQIRLCGAKQKHLPALEAHPQYRSTAWGSSEPVVTLVTDENLKALPKDTSSIEYQAGFLEGWVAMDGSNKPSGSLSLSSQDHAAISWAVERAPLLGFCVTGDNYDSTVETNYGRREALVRRVTLDRRATTYRVCEIVDEGREEEVFCVTEEVTSQFTLGGGFVTGNCAFLSTGTSFSPDFARTAGILMDLSMLGVGVGFDTLGAGDHEVYKPMQGSDIHVIEDSREGWIAATERCIRAYLDPVETMPLQWDYSAIRPAGAPIRGFGGVAAGHAPLKHLLEVHIPKALDPLAGDYLTSSAIVDIMCMIGRCVVSGNVRRSALIGIGQADDEAYLDLKDPDKANGALMGEDSWRWSANLSVEGVVGMDYSEPGARSGINGEPGYVWLDNIRRFGRMADPADEKDFRVMGVNPCAEMGLEHAELCTLVETFPARHASLAEFLRTLKYAYMYAKTVALVGTHIHEVNTVMRRNRRIGVSQTGITQNFARVGRREHYRWCDAGYQYLKQLDVQYSDWLAVPRSIKLTTVKPSGTVSKLPGSTAGVHWPLAEHYIQRMRIAPTNPLLAELEAAGYHVEQDSYDPNSMVVEFPVKEAHFTKGSMEIPVSVQMKDVADMQRWWADNAVSVTVMFDKEKEADLLPDLLSQYEADLKTVSFLPYVREGQVWDQAPWEAITAERYEEMVAKLQTVRSTVDAHERAAEDRFCEGASCTI